MSTLKCNRCNSNQFEVSYSTDGSKWELSLICDHCGVITEIATTDEYIPDIKVIEIIK